MPERAPSPTRRLRLALLGAVAMGWPVATASLHASPPDDDLQASVYLIVAPGQGSGTGFVVAPGIIATNAHVAMVSDNFLVFAPNSRRDQGLPARVLWQDAPGDMALLQVDGAIGPPLPLGLAPHKKGIDVYAVGYPGRYLSLQQLNETVDSRETSSRIEFVTTTSMDWNPPVSGRMLHVLLHGAQILPGNSGGPLFDDCGRVIGINSALATEKLESGAILQAGNISIAIEELVDAVERAGRKIAFRKATDACNAGAAATPSPSASPTPVPSATPVANAELAAQKRPLWASIATGVGVAALVGLVLLALIRLAGRRKPNGPETPPSPEPASGGRAALALVGDGAAIEIDLALASRRFGMIVGRSATFCDGVVRGESVSRRHARFTQVDGVLRVEDLGSAHGTSVDGVALRPFDPRPIAAGSSVAFGAARYRIAAEQAAKPTAGRYDTYLIGRREDCDLVIRGDATVGRHHAELSIAANDQALLTDRKSSAGTAVKRGSKWQALSTLALTPDMQIRFGATEISAARLIATAQSRPAPAPAPPRPGASDIIRRDPMTGEIVGN